MCIAIPGKVLQVEGLHATVDFQGSQVQVNTGLVSPQPGQYVLVHAGCAIEVMEKDRAEELIQLFGEIEEMERQL